MSEVKSKKDWFINLVSGMGTGADKSAHTQYRSSRIPYVTQCTLFNEDWIIRKACMKPSNDAMRNGLFGDSSDILEANGVYTAIKSVVSLARGFGGAVIVILANDGKEVSEPLTDLQDGGFRLIAIDRHEVIRQDTHDFFFNTSEQYMINGVTFHESRIIEVQGGLLTHQEFMRRGFWGSGIIETAYKSVATLNSVWSYIEQIAADSSIGVIKIPGLSEAQNSEELSRIVQKRLDFMNQNKSVFRGIGIDSDEDFQWIMRTFQGVDMITDIFQLRVSANLDVPESILFGKQSTGMGGNENKDQNTYDDLLTDIRQTKVNPILDRITELMSIDKPEWNPIKHMSASESSEIRLKHSQALASEADIMGLSEDEARAISKNTGLDIYDELSDNAPINNFSEDDE